ncbi:MAG: hypothetical protein IPL65_20110 [Lewinellaceae bacterium]|nr:hypothetical protein [Lewinellaceae bacterium]
MRYAVLILLCCAVSSGWSQSPWARSKAGFYLQASGNFIPTYNTLFDEVLLPREVSEGTFQLYGEYGISKHTTLVVDLPLRFLKTGEAVDGSGFQNNNPGTLRALGNLGVAIRHQFNTENFALAATLKASLPTAKTDDASGLRSDYDALTLLPMLSVGKGWGKAYGYAYAGYGYRSNDFYDFANAGIEAGYKVGPVWLVGFSRVGYARRGWRQHTISRPLYRAVCK